jgi:DNA repair exonuclease SbcCD ATPase subunit
MNITDLRDRLDLLKNQHAGDKAMRDSLNSSKLLKDTEWQSLATELSLKELAKFLLTKTAEEAREVARQRLESIVTNALQYVFGPDFNFVIEMKESRGRAEADFYVESIQGANVVRTDPMVARGGGVVDIIAIALQLAIVQIHQNPRIQGPIILDEPGKHVDTENAIKLAMFLNEMSHHFNRQIIMVTHQPHLAEIAGNSYNIELKGGRSIATKRVELNTASSESNDGSDTDGFSFGTESAMSILGSES